MVGGIVNITSKGPSSDFNGSVEVQTSQGLDAYGYNLVNGSLTGPIWKQKKTNKAIIGFFAAFEYLNQKDPDPSAVGVWQVRQDVLDELRQHPLIRKESSSGFSVAAENLAMKDMYMVKVKPNTSSQNFPWYGSLRYWPRRINITLAFGGSASYNQYHDWVEKYTLLNSKRTIP